MNKDVAISAEQTINFYKTYPSIMYYPAHLVITISFQTTLLLPAKSEVDTFSL